jgi:anthranilate/para-aminobenzoate synthase component I
VGGGLTADSELMNEWEETRMKAETLTAVIRE